MLSRRSVRKYRPDPVPTELIQQLLEVGTHAGTGSNMQADGFLVLRDREQLEKLEQAVIRSLWSVLRHFDGSGLMHWLLVWIYGPIIAAKYVAYHNIIKHRRDHGELQGMIFRNAPMVIVAYGLRKYTISTTNGALALRNMELLALTLGLGTCWVGFLTVAGTKRRRKFNALLGLGPQYVVTGALMVGYPRHSYPVMIPRRARDVRWS
jgi:nitroreductase